MIKKLDDDGFTIVELLISTAVFTTILLIVTFGIIQISRMFTSGFIQTQTQNVAVSLSDQLTRDIEFSSASSIQTDQLVNISGTNYYYFCTYQFEYFYTPGGSLYKIPLATITNCQTPDTKWLSNSQTQNLLSSNMKVLNNSGFNDSSQQSIINNGASSGLYTINLDILYGNTTNLVQNNKATLWICKPVVIVGPFCANYILNTQAYAQD